ncbi:MAG TPA: hypothetical protein VEK80_15490 [Kribbellaceae bacterium]|nr:hypothetical protein [Kribbellaceae bacterium]
MRVSRSLTAAVTLAALTALLAPAAPATADGPGSGTPTIVSLGDSAISGEAGRWAGNTNQSSSWTDALGPTAYYDNATNSAETIPGCHRSKAAEVHIASGVVSRNLACSGARTTTSAYDPDSDFKPGIDFYDDGAGHIGQAKALQQYAATHNVTAVTLRIGANNYHFADIVETCVLDWYFSPWWAKNYCQDDSNIAPLFTASNVAAETANIKTAILNVRTAMANAGYADSSYTILVNTYWNPVPRGSQIRYPETGYTRQTTGGCGVWNKDADWANDTVVPTINSSVKNAASAAGLSNVKILDMQTFMNGHRLCENTVGLLEEKGLTSWTQAGAADKTEWFEQIRTSSTVGGPYQLQEDAHANYWGQLAMRNCLRQAYNSGAVRGGKCVSTGGLTPGGEPNATLQ